MTERSSLTSVLVCRDHSAEDVYVTGTFDDWAKSVKLDKKQGHFEKLVNLPYGGKKIYYKVRKTMLSSRLQQSSLTNLNMSHLQFLYPVH